ncbi:MAG: hypothetical protein QOD74_1224 [Variibacter sp.]|jgi:hypothetical protein|nr:hypothetical protein [Variibacter sp.]
MKTEQQKMLDGELYDPSIVTRDIPDGVFAADNPCRVVREITE